MPPNFTWTEWTFVAKNFKGSLIVLSGLRDKPCIDFVGNPRVGVCWWKLYAHMWTLKRKLVPVQIKDCRFGVHFIFTFWALWDFSSAFTSSSASPQALAWKGSILPHPDFSCKQLLSPLLLPRTKDWKLHSSSCPWWEKICVPMWALAKNKNLTQALISVTDFITAMRRRLIKEMDVWN